jgi:hypothetical protein
MIEFGRGLGGRDLLRMYAEVFAHFKLHPVNLLEEACHRSVMVGRVRLCPTEMGDLALKLRYSIYCDRQFLVIRDHENSFRTSMIPRLLPSRFSPQPDTISASLGKHAARLTQNTLAPKCA